MAVIINASSHVRRNLIWIHSAALYLSLAGTIAVAATTSAEDQDHLSIALQKREIGGPEHRRARGFLWRHWISATPAQLDVTSWTREGVRNDWHYELMRGEDSKPVLAVTRKTAKDPDAPITGLAVPKGETPRAVEPSLEKFKIFAVERIKRVANSEKVVVVPESKSLAPNQYKLRFRDEKGDVIGTF